MKKIIYTFLLFLAFSKPVYCIDSQDIIKLKKVGISDETIQAMIEEKTLETCSFTTDEIVDLKKEGLSDNSIRILIKTNTFNKDNDPVVYGGNIKPVKSLTIKDIHSMKNAGLSDELIKAIIEKSQNGDLHSDDLNEDVWDVLKKMGIVIDDRLLKGDK